MGRWIVRRSVRKNERRGTNAEVDKGLYGVARERKRMRERGISTGERSRQSLAHLAVEKLIFRELMFIFRCVSSLSFAPPPLQRFNRDSVHLERESIEGISGLVCFASVDD